MCRLKVLDSSAEMWRIGHGIAAAFATFQYQLDVLTGVVFKHFAGWQLQMNQHHISRFFFQFLYTRWQSLNGECAFQSHLARL